MSDDKVFYGTILALFALMTGNPFIALIIFFLSII
jgi:uncharacterized membrane protein